MTLREKEDELNWKITLCGEMTEELRDCGMNE
jgi:hypothetical protein